MNGEKPVNRIAIILMIISLISKVFGFVREITLSYFYGASNISDAYLISMTIPGVIFSFIGVGITTGYIPMYNRIKKEEGISKSNYFTNNLISITVCACTLIIIIVQLFAGSVVKVFASGFEGETLNMAVRFTKLTVLGIYFTGIISIFNGYLQIMNSFIVPGVLGFIYNIFIISSLYISYKYNILILAIGSVLALIFQLIFLGFFVKGKGLRYNFALDIKDKYIISMGKMTLPLIFGISVSQINILVDKTIASQLVMGGISTLNYADRLNSFILSTIVMSISISIYPLMSKFATENNIDEFKKVISKSIGAINVLIIPSTVGAMVFSYEIVSLLFARGAFSSDAIVLTSKALFYYSIGMIGIGLREVLMRAFFSMQDTKTPMINAAIGMILNIMLNLILSRFLGVGGLALATSISATFTIVLLFISLRKKIGPFGIRQLSISFVKVLIASLIMGLVSKLCFNYLTTNILSQNLSLLIAIGVGVTTYFTIIYFLKIPDVDTIVSTVKSKFRRKSM